MSANRRPPFALLCPLLLCACAQAPSPPAAADTAPAVASSTQAARADTRADTRAEAVVPATVAVTPAIPAPEVTAAPASSTRVTTPATTTPASASALSVLVHKTPTCGCCSKWVDHMRAQGFRVEVRDHEDLVAVKQRLGVPLDKASCHTAEVGGYFVEGHVPADDVKRLLAEKPKARGITAPGMPMGSPGMETPDGSVQPYTVELVQADGTVVAYATHGR